MRLVLLLICLPLFLPWQASANGPAGAGKVHYRSPGDSLVEDSLPRPSYFLQLSASLGAESRDLTTRQLLDFTQQSYLNTAEKDELFNAVDNRLGLGYRQHWQLRYGQQASHDSAAFPQKWSIGIFNRSYISLSLSKDLYALALYGNQRFANQSADLSESRYQSWLYSGLQYQFTFQAMGLPWQVGANLLIGHSHADYHLPSASLFTEAQGRYLEFSGSYQFRQAQSGGEYSIAGMGTSVDIATQWRWSSHTLELSLQDFGLIYWTRAQTYALDSTFRFEGIFIDDLFTLRDSLARAEGDKYRQALFTEDAANYAALTPFRAQIRYNYRLSNSPFKMLYGYLRYRYLPAYLPKLGLGTLYQFHPQHQLTAEAAWGGFNHFTTALGYRWQLNSHWILQGSLSNLWGIALPDYGYGTVLSGSIRYNF